VYASISALGIAGPVFIEGRVNAKVYVEKVLPVIAFEIKNRMERTDDPTTTRMVPNTRTFIFQQDLASSHTSGLTQTHLQQFLPNFLPKESTPPAFVEWPIECFWNQIKTIVYSKKSKNMKELKLRIRKAFRDFDVNWLKNTWESMPKRMDAIIQAKGGHTKY
jgi:hypothetical protein